MKGVILAGGTGSRMFPLTKVTNKHLLPIYNQPMVYYPLQMLLTLGIRDVLVVTGGTSSGDFLRLLGNGSEFGLNHLTYAYQEGEGGIAAALRLAEYFVDGDTVCVALGDNLIEKNVCAAAERFRRQGRGARLILKDVPDPQRFGVPVFDADKIIAIEEKPAKPKSPYAVTGIYFYDSSVFRKIERLKPSARGELEITDVNNFYIEEGTLEYDFLDGWWTDAGTFDSLLLANKLVKQTGANNVARTGAAG